MHQPFPDSLPALLHGWAAKMPDAVALREKDLGRWREISWREYAGNVASVARALYEVGVRAGDHVAILSDNRPEWLYCDLGAQTLGARGVGIYQTNPPADVAYVLQHSGSRVLFCEDQEQVDKAVEIAAETPTVTRVIVIDSRGMRGYSDPRLESWSDFVARGKNLLAAEPGWFEAQLAQRDPEAPAMVVYTSGTTGQPKGAMLSARNVIEVGRQLVAMQGTGHADSMLSYLPLCHVAEKIFTMFQPLLSGSIVHFGESIETVREDLREVSPTVFLGVPRIWEKMHASITLKMKDASWLKRTLYRRAVAFGMRASERRRAGTFGWRDRIAWRIYDLLIFRALQERIGLRNCRLPITGAAPIAPELLAWFHAIGVPILEAYGQTEVAGASHSNRIGEERLGTVGPVIPGLEHRLDEDGEVLVRGPAVFCGYLHDPEATRRTVDEEGWLHTGDIGTLDDAGHLIITGRKKEILITAGGKNLSPEKIENTLKMSPYIKEVVAIGDRRSFVAALVQIDGDAVGDWASRRGLAYGSFQDLAAKDEVRALISAEIDAANERLARVEQVRAFRLLTKELHQDDGELTATQKVRRRAVGELYGAIIEEMYRAR